MRDRFSVVIPVYNHEKTLREVVIKALELQMPVFVVDDGSTDNSYKQISDISGISILRHQSNLGKGAALWTGFLEASRIADWSVTLDADGQHDPAEVQNLLRALPADGRPLVLGLRQGMVSAEVPWSSRFGRKFSNFWVLASCGMRLADTQSGFRIYPLPEVLDLDVKSSGYQFEIEALVQFCRKNTRVIEVPVSVNYSPPGARISHFRPFVDFLRNSRLFCRLITQRIYSQIFKGELG